MRADAAAVLVSLGYTPDVDFIAVQEGLNVRVDWLSVQPQPTEAEIDAAAPNASANLLVLDRPKVVAKLTGVDLNDKILRSLLLITLDEFNLHALKINAILSAVDGASSFGNLKSAIAAIADYPTRTKAQLVTAMTNKINAGDADAA